MIKPGNKPGGTRLVMTPERKRVFLQTLRTNGGNIMDAAKVASPNSLSKTNPGYSSFRQLMVREPEFQAAVDEVLEGVLSDVVGVIYQRAMHGTREAVIQKGEQAKMADGTPAWIVRYDNRLLLRLAAKLDPAWSEKRSVEHSGTVVHKAGMSMADLLALSPAERDQVEAAFLLLQGVRDDPKAIEHQPMEIMDADFEEVDEDEDTMAALDRIEQEEAQ